jgi:hypothetical protein
MRIIHPRGMAAIVLGALLLVAGTAAQGHAHALYAAHSWHEGVVLVQFAYAGGEQPTYAKVEVYSPADARVEFQNGRTDAQGRFAFMPDAPGLWRIIMADNMGHRVEHPMEVNAALQAATTAGGAPPTEVGPGDFAMPLRILLGLSLIANMTLAAAVLRRKKNQPA